MSWLSHEMLATIWFVLVFVLLIGYAVLDGFDLGVGALHLLARGDHERRVSMNSIGPVWDGNEVWLLTGGGALFAAFPPVYAAVFSGFYLALMLLLLALIARAVAMEFRSKVESPRWRRVWDVAFSAGSLLAAVLFGVAFGNIVRGIPINADGDFAGTFLGLLNPYSVSVGVFCLLVFLLHGAIYLAMKSDGDLHRRTARLIKPLYFTVLGMWVGVTLFTAVAAPRTFSRAFDQPLTYLLLPLLVGSLLYLPKAACACKPRYGRALIASGTLIATLMSLAAVGMFPELVPSSLGPFFSLHIHEHSSSTRTLLTMLVIAGIGMPLVIAYTAIIYRAFRGKVVLTEESY